VKLQHTTTKELTQYEREIRATWGTLLTHVSPAVRRALIVEHVTDACRTRGVFNKKLKRDSIPIAELEELMKALFERFGLTEYLK
jgi:hypothetical protein